MLPSATGMQVASLQSITFPDSDAASPNRPGGLWRDKLQLVHVAITLYSILGWHVILAVLCIYLVQLQFCNVRSLQLFLATSEFCNIC